MTVRVFGHLTLYETRGVYQFVVAKVETESEGGMWKLAFEPPPQAVDRGGAHRCRPKAYPAEVPANGGRGHVAGERGVARHRRGGGPTGAVGAAGGSRREGAGGERRPGGRRCRSVSGDDRRGRDRGRPRWRVRGGPVGCSTEEPVARAVAASPVPVVSGVGHETDVTICDLVADLRAATPSAAAEAVVPERKDVEQLLDGYARRLGKALALRVRFQESRLERGEDAIWAPRPSSGTGAAARASKRDARRSSAPSVAGSDATPSVWPGRPPRWRRCRPSPRLARGYALPLDGDGRLLRATTDFTRSWPSACESWTATCRAR